MANPLEMDDDAFLAQGDPVPEVTTPEDAAQEDTAEAETQETELPVEGEEDALTDAEKAAAADDVEKSQETPADSTIPSVVEPPAAEVPAADTAEKPAVAPEPPAETVDYASFYTKIMTPFKANGRQIELKTPEEAIQLMQQGANYTKRMQELAPHRKVLLMLEKNGLLDEGKLGFLIDIEKRDPAAIQKLVKDSGIDPMDIDVSKEPEYRAGAHQVGDDEAKFMSALEDLKSSPAGVETLKHINDSWDTKSKDHLWTSPEAMATIHAHRESGVYDRIATELDRRKVLGTIAAAVPFLEAYRQVGEEMATTNAFDDLITPIAPTSAQAAAPKVVATRVAAPKPTVSNSPKAAAAASTRAAPVTAQSFVNPLSQSDDEFMKQFEGRL